MNTRDGKSTKIVLDCIVLEIVLFFSSATKEGLI
jgi:hypothetical protein